MLYFHWSLFAVLLLYWLDTVVIGVLSATRARLAHLEREFPSGRPTPEWRTRTVAGFGFAFFFFNTMIGVFLVALFGSIELRQLGRRSSSVVDYLAEVLLQPEIAVAVLATVASRGFDFYVNYLRPRAYETAHVSDQMVAALGRVAVLSAVIVGGGLLIAWLRTPLAALVLLVLLKTVGDVLSLVYRKR